MSLHSYSDSVTVIDSAAVEFTSAYFVQKVDGKLDIMMIMSWELFLNTDMFSELIFREFVNRVEGMQLPAELHTTIWVQGTKNRIYSTGGKA